MKKFDVILPVILFSYFIILLDNSVIFTGTVKIAEDLHLNKLSLSWVSNAYALTFGGFLLCGARMGDIFGRKRMFMAGLVIFGIGSFLVGSAQGAASIIIARAFQGLGSAVLAPTTLALLMDSYTGDARIRAVAYYGATAGIGACVGLIVGGVVSSFFTWRYGFYINIPICLILFLMAMRHIPENKQREGSIDYIGAITSIIAATALVYSIVGEVYKFYALMIAFIFLLLFIFQQTRARLPMLPLRIFNDRTRSGAYIARFFYMGALLSLWFITPQLMQLVWGFTPLQAGLAFFPFTIINFVFAMQVANLTFRWGNTKLLIVGISTTLAGMMMLIFFKAESGYWIGIALPMLFMGAGQGMSLSPMTLAGVANTSAEDAGAAAGTVNIVHQIGGAVGLSIVVASSGFIKGGTVSEYRLEMFIASIFLIIALLSSILLILPGTGKVNS